MVDHFSNNVSNHGAKAVAATLSRMGSILDWGSIEAEKAFQAARTTTLKNPAAVLDYWTDQRHKMIHQGKAVAIKAPQARKVIDFVEAPGAYVDQEADKAKQL